MINIQTELLFKKKSITTTYGVSSITDVVPQMSRIYIVTDIVLTKERSITTWEE